MKHVKPVFAVFLTAIFIFLPSVSLAETDVWKEYDQHESLDEAAEDLQEGEAEVPDEEPADEPEGGLRGEPEDRLDDGLDDGQTPKETDGEEDEDEGGVDPASLPLEIEELDGEEQQLDVSLYSIVITAGGYRLDDGDEIPFTGSYRLSQQQAKTDNRLAVESGIHQIVIEDVHIDRSQAGGAAFEIGEGAIVRLELEGSGSFVSGDHHAGIQLLVNRDQGKEAQLIISGSGSLYACGGKSGAGIGGGLSASNGKVIINSGTVRSEGGTGGAGIGGGNNASSYKVNDCDGGAITINGGSITAVGGDSAAGIGGGNHGDGGAITITGGVVVLAQGGGGGAGIGSGLGSHVKSDKGPGYYTGGQIRLEGDYLIEKALGGGNAAGIGGGMYSDSGNVVILGGQIKLARGGEGTAGSYHHGAAGIGAGYQGHCRVFIRQAHIEKAVGSFSGAGIGSGATANLSQRENQTVAGESTVFICSSYIDLAQGGEYGGAGIGGGVSCDRVTVTLCGHRITAKGGPGGAGVGSGLYSESYKYFCKTAAVVNIQCGALEAIGDGGDDVGQGQENDPPQVSINADEVDLTGTPSIPSVEADGYEGYYDGRAYGITVAIANASITYSHQEEGPYEEEKPMFKEVGEYLTYYRADEARYTFYGSETVVIKPLEEGGENGAEKSGGWEPGSQNDQGEDIYRVEADELLNFWDRQETAEAVDPADSVETPECLEDDWIVVGEAADGKGLSASWKENPKTGSFFAGFLGRIMVILLVMAAVAAVGLLKKQNCCR